MNVIKCEAEYVVEAIQGLFYLKYTESMANPLRGQDTEVCSFSGITVNVLNS